jgi:23S rRNA (guanosine2251-2'-O)-methyltransferase
METMPKLEAHRLGIPLEALPPVPRTTMRLVLDQVRSALNTGAIFRTADAAALEMIYLLGVTPHPPHPQVEKTALGGSVYVPWRHRENILEAESELLADGYTLVALDNGPDAQELWDFEWPDRPALVAGHEVEGVSPEVLARCPVKVCLPMFGYKRSLNVTTALGIAIYDYLRRMKKGAGSE